MLDIFASVCARAVDITWTTEAGEKREFRRNTPFDELLPLLPAILAKAAEHRRNVIVRPHGPGVSFVQLDDLAGDQLARVAAVAFLVVETSAGNHQAWLAMPGRQTKEFVRRIKKATGADTGASGAIRLAGSVNYKPEHAPDYPRVTIREAAPGRTVTAAELERRGLVAAPEVYASLPPPRFVRNAKWPSYDKALAGAPINTEGTGPDRSRADYVWCMTAISWGFEIGETAMQLMREDSKARQLLAEPGGERKARAYAVLTATKAGEAVERRQPTAKPAEHSRR
jgi:RepB DNA-primase from phage plasmid